MSQEHGAALDAPAALFDDAVLGPNRREDSGDRNGQLVSVDQGSVTSRNGCFGQPPIMKNAHRPGKLRPQSKSPEKGDLSRILFS